MLHVYYRALCKEVYRYPILFCGLHRQGVCPSVTFVVLSKLSSLANIFNGTLLETLLYMFGLTLKHCCIYLVQLCQVWTHYHPYLKWMLYCLAIGVINFLSFLHMLNILFPFQKLIKTFEETFPEENPRPPTRYKKRVEETSFQVNCSLIYSYIVFLP